MENPQLICRFHSWKEAFKSPFGAVQVGEIVKFRFNCEVDHPVSIYLIIHKDFQPGQEIKMIPEQNGWFEVLFPVSEGNGLYYYHFRVIQETPNGSSTSYYCNNEAGRGGEGRLVKNADQIANYQLTAYKERERFPVWFSEGLAYQIFVDRFYNGEEDGKVLHPKPNSFLYSTPDDLPMYIRDDEGEIARWEFFGGNLKGILKKLPYLQEMGITILYLTPIFKARSNHKYDTGDYFEIDEMFGTLEDFEELVSEARKKDIRIILDGVFNHTGADSRYFNRFGTYDELGAYQSRDSLYAGWYTFQSFPKEYTSWWGVLDVPTLHTENPDVREFLYKGENSVVKYWTRKGIGGFRLDVADELSDEVLGGIRQAMVESSPDFDETVLIGEVWEDATNKIAYGKRRHYMEGGMLQSVMNYPFRKWVIQLLNGELTPKETMHITMNLRENYPADVFFHLFNNIGSHDTERIKTALGSDERKVRLALVLLLTFPGVPCLYYGDETGVEGGTDPDNRRTYPWHQQNQELISFVQELSKKRRSSPSFQRGQFVPFHAGQLFGYLRLASSGEWDLILINPTEETAKCLVETLRWENDFSLKKLWKEQGLKEYQLEPMDFKWIKSKSRQDS